MVILSNWNVFLAVAESGSFTKAAATLHISQPAASKAIAALEEELSVRLFLRDKRKGLLLTNAGQKILPLVRQMRQLDDRIAQTAYQESHLLDGVVKIASVPIMTSLVLAEVLPEYQESYPYVQVEIMDGTNWGVKKMVEEYRADFGLAISPFPGLMHTPLIRDRMVAVTKEKLPPDTVFHLTEYDKPLLFGEAGYEVVADYLGRKNLAIREPRIFRQGDTAIQLVRKGNGVGIISEYVLKFYTEELFVYPIRPAISTEYAIIAHAMQELSPAASAFVERILHRFSRGY